MLFILLFFFFRNLGGLGFSLRLRDHLAAKFNEMKKTPNDVTQNPRAMAKLLKEANRVKTVLSANADHYAQIEGLLDEQDFRIQVMIKSINKSIQLHISMLVSIFSLIEI